MKYWKRSLKTMLTLALLAGVFLALRELPVLAWVTQIDAEFAQLGAWGILVFPLFYALVNLLMLPGGSLVAMSGGFFFGPILGAALILSGNMIGATGAILIARAFGQRWLKARIDRSPRWSRLNAAFEREGSKIVFLTQLHPLFPTSILNYVYGITPISLGRCLFWIALGQIPSCLLFGFLGAVSQQGIDLLHGKGAPEGTLSLVLKGSGLALSLVITYLLGRMALRLLAETEEKPVPEISKV